MKEIINVLPKLQEIVRERQIAGRPNGITICDSTDLAKLAGVNSDSHVAVMPDHLQSVVNTGGTILIDTHGNLGILPANGNAKP